MIFRSGPIIESCLHLASIFEKRPPSATYIHFSTSTAIGNFLRAVPASNMPRAEDKTSPALLLFYCFLMVTSAILNSLTYKKMLNSFKSQDPVNHPHNYEFFVNQINVAMYWAVAAIIVRTKAASNPKW